MGKTKRSLNKEDKAFSKKNKLKAYDKGKSKKEKNKEILKGILQYNDEEGEE